MAEVAALEWVSNNPDITLEHNRNYTACEVTFFFVHNDPVAENR